MQIPRIYHPQLLSTTTVELNPQTSHRITHVLRLKVNHHVLLFDGSSNEYLTRITSISKQSVKARIERRHTISRESPLQTELAQCISRGNRMDYAIQKSVELGVSQITPIISKRCNVGLDRGRMQKKLSHWQGIIIHACEQSGRGTIPILNRPCAIESWLAQCNTDTKLVASPYTAMQAITKQHRPKSVSIIIGPEGGLTEYEVAQAQQHDFACFSLGPRILRTETACVAALSVIQQLWGDFNLQ